MAHLQSTGAHPGVVNRVALIPCGRVSFVGARLPRSIRPQHAEIRRGPLPPSASTPGESWSRALSAGAARAREFFQLGKQTDPVQQAEDSTSQSPTNSGDESVAEPEPESAANESLSALVVEAAAEPSIAAASSPSRSDPAVVESPIQMVQALVEVVAKAEISPEEADWQEWKKYIEALDEQAREVADIDDEMDRAVADERYGDAAALKRDMDKFVASDLVYGALMDMETALAEERYADAAKLRDTAGTNLMGWWVGRGENDSQGHLLRVSAGYSRFVGQAYLPKELAEVRGAVSSGQVTEEEGDDMLDHTGCPLLEMFLRRAPDGSLEQRLAAMRGSDMSAEDGPASIEQQLVDSLAAFSNGKGTITVDEEGPDGSVRMTVDLSNTGDVPDPDTVEDLGFSSMEGSSDGFEIISPGNASSGMLPFNVSASGTVEATAVSDTIHIIESNVQLDRVPAELRSMSRDAFTIHIPAPPEDFLSAEEEDSPREPLDEPVSLLLADPPVKTDSDAEEGDSALPTLLTSLAKQAKERGGRVVPSREQMRQLLTGVVSEIKEPPAVPLLLELSGTITYQRLPLDLPRTDPFNGIYMASYGEHGPEMLRLYRQTIDGEEVVIAQKLTGDDNMPAGELTFKAPVGRLNRLDHRDMYPPEFAVTQRYKAQGQVAGPGMTNKRWVPGELLMFSGNGMLTGSATLGFLWCIPGHRQFLVPLFRCDLGEP